MRRDDPGRFAPVTGAMFSWIGRAIPTIPYHLITYRARPGSFWHRPAHVTTAVQGRRGRLLPPDPVPGNLGSAARSSHLRSGVPRTSVPGPQHRSLVSSFGSMRARSPSPPRVSAAREGRPPGPSIPAGRLRCPGFGARVGHGAACGSGSHLRMAPAKGVWSAWRPVLRPRHRVARGGPAAVGPLRSRSTWNIPPVASRALWAPVAMRRISSTTSLGVFHVEHAVRARAGVRHPGC